MSGAFDLYMKDEAGNWNRADCFQEGYFFFPKGTEIPKPHEYLRWTVGEYYWPDNGTRTVYPEFTAENSQFRPWLDVRWRAREARKFEKGEYQPLPWDLPAIEDHYAHIALGAENMVAFTESDRKGQEDRQTRLKPGRYVQRFYPHLSQDEIRAYACQIDNVKDLQIATSAEDIIHVYTHGPHSCMAYGVEEFSSDIHPVSVYGNSDLQLAFLSSVGIEDERFRASARALIWPSKKVYGRIYGDAHRLSEKLQAEGYREGSLEGAKMRLIREDDQIVSPYVDHIQKATVSDCGKWLVVDRDGDVNTEVTDGYAINQGRNFCEYYDQYTNEEVYYVDNRGEYWCESACNNYAFYCEGYDQYYSRSVGYEHIDGCTYSLTWLENNATKCEETGEWFLDSDDVAEIEDQEKQVSLAWAQENAWQDVATGKWYSEEPKAEDDDAEDDSEEAVEPRCPLTLELPLEMAKAAPESSEAVVAAMMDKVALDMLDQMTNEFLAACATGTRRTAQVDFRGRVYPLLTEMTNPCREVEFPRDYLATPFFSNYRFI